jgi:FtsH-binding integral membrane protein
LNLPALAKPPLFLIVVIFGFLATMVCFGPHQPNRPTIVLLSLYTLLVGLVIFMILAFSDPFQGSTGVDPTAIEFVLEQIQ